MQNTGPGRASGEEDTEALNRDSRQKQTSFHSTAPRQLGSCDGVQDWRAAQTWVIRKVSRREPRGQTPEGGGTEASVVVEELSVLSLQKSF